MGIIASCGHRVDELDDLVNCSTKAWEITEEGWVKAIHYQSLCKECYREFQIENAVLYTEESEANWLRQGDDQ